jgi:hypothetical protein
MHVPGGQEGASPAVARDRDRTDATTITVDRSADNRIVVPFGPVIQMSLKHSLP